jgi:teichuronic acid biosynthesis glycosyltransferase TuaC
VSFCGSDLLGEPFDRHRVSAFVGVRAARDRGLDVELHAAAAVPHDQMPAWLNAADVLLVTSAQEGSPNVGREALACGTPVVSVPVGDVARQLAGIDGCHVVDDDPRTIGAALEAVAGRTTPIDTNGRLAGASAVAVARQVEAVYRQVVGR